jgi:hypothetical protein
VLLTEQVLEQCEQLLGMTVVARIDHDRIGAEQNDGVGAQPAALEHHHIAWERLCDHALGFNKNAVMKLNLKTKDTCCSRGRAEPS